MTDSPALPRALDVWAESLALLPHDLALALGPWLGRLNAAFGPTLRRAPRVEATEPDGYEGLSRVGPYDRLLLSEWLLAEEVPLEFDRRAAMGEHAFLALAHSPPMGASHLSAALDAGAGQLGAPRLAQLATLIVLTRRCEAQGGELRWTVAQRPTLGPFLGLSHQGVRQWLDARNAPPLDLEALAEWRATQRAEGVDDHWWIGARHPALPGDMPRVLIEEPLWVADDAQTPALEVSVCRAHAPPKTVTLPGLDPGKATRLLRDPFEGVGRLHRQRQGVDLPSPPTWAQLHIPPGANRVVGWVGPEQCLAWHLPNSPNGAHQLGRTRALPAFIRGAIAAGWHGRSFVAMTATEAELALWWKGKIVRRWVRPIELDLPDTPQPLLVPQISPPVLMLLDRQRDLFLFDERAAPVCLASNVLAAKPMFGDFMVIRAEGGKVHVGCERSSVSNALVPVTLDVGCPPEAFIGNTYHHGRPPAAIKAQPDLWWGVLPKRAWQSRLDEAGEEMEPSTVLPIHVKPADKVWGVVADPGAGGAVRLVVEPEEAHSLLLVGPDGEREPIPEMTFGEHELCHVAVGHEQPMVAAWTSVGWLKVVELGWKAALLSRPGDRSP